jgi:ligand-binding SRPBCC domain-containing protein
MKTYVLEHHQEIKRPRSETFAFFADAFNLELITPGFLRFRILTPRPVSMRAGTLLEYQLSLFGLPFRWKTLIESWSPDDSFVDVQLEGPYLLWRHTHSFEETSRDCTLVRDHVEYQLPLGAAGRLANGLVVAKMLEKIFEHRAQAIAGLLAPVNKPTEIPRAETAGANSQK